MKARDLKGWQSENIARAIAVFMAAYGTAKTAKEK
jgi:hypothetical protein